MTDMLLLISIHYADDSSPTPEARVLTLSTLHGDYRRRVFQEEDSAR
jgi:hypothetical protein